MNNNIENQPIVVDSEKQSISDNLHTEYYFPSGTYHIIKEEFLEAISTIANQKLEQIKKERPQPNEIYPVYQTGSLFEHESIDEFCNYIGNTAWNILDSQGFDMSSLVTTIDEMWCQEHYKYSGHEEHTHGFGAQLVGFYFLETPEDCSRIVIHDPRPAKRQINLMEKNISDVTFASNMINYIPKPGMLFFANAWLPHSFTRNASDKPMKFIHFTIGVRFKNKQQACPTTSEPEII